MGEVELPEGARWGAQTERARRNFPISDRRLPRAAITAFGMVKEEAALANGDLDAVPAVTPEVARAIATAAREVRDGGHDGQFPVDVYQSGSGTSWNMNANEVIAHRAGELLGSPVHPNDQVNASQSSNDVVPTVVRISTALGLRDEVVPAAGTLSASLQAAADRLDDVVSAGRTHLADAVPLTLGQQIGGWAAQVDESVERIEALLPRLCRLPLGGTAVGTGLNCPAGFVERVIGRLASTTGLPLTEAPDHFAVQGAHDAVVEAVSSLRGLALVLGKIAGDLRLLSSGPVTGLGELHLPALQPGSSIMPGKVNPVVPEAVLQVTARVVGNDATAAWAASTGELQLGVHVPVLGHVAWESVGLCAAAARLLAERCIDGLDADRERCEHSASATPALVTVLAPVVGYEAAALVVHEAADRGVSIQQAAVDAGLLEAGQADELLDPARLARPPGPAAG